MGLVGLLEKEKVSNHRAGISENLPNRLTADEQKEFERLYVPISDRLFNYARKLAGNHHYAEDLVQETVRKAISAFPGQAIGENFHSWMVVILRNTYFDEQRHLSRYKTISLDNLGNTIASGEDVVHKEELTELVCNLRTAVSELGEEHRQAVSLYLYDGLNYKVISHILSIPLNTVKSRMASAKTRLAEILKQSPVDGLMEEAFYSRR